MPLIAAARFNTGIAGYYDIPAEYHDAITVSLNGAGCGSTLYHHGNFAITGDAMAMICKTEISELAKLFIAAVCDSYFTSHYSYTDKCSPDKAAQDIISLPVTPAGTPDWSYMEEYMRGIQSRADAALDTLSAVCSADDIGGGIETREWKKFYLMHTDNHDGLFECSRGMRLTKTDRIDGDIPLLTAGIGVGQGIAQYIAPVESMQLYREDITVDMFGEAFVHDYPHYGDDNIHFMTNDEINKACKLYICSVINRQTAGVYSYTKQFRINTLKDMTISLPVTPSGTPDWDYMEEYMRRIEKRAEQALDTLSSVEQVAA